MKSLVLACKQHIHRSETSTTHKVLGCNEHYVTANKINDENKSTLTLRSHLHTQTNTEADCIKLITIGFNHAEGILILITNFEIRLYNDELHQIGMFESERRIDIALINYDSDVVAAYLESKSVMTIKIHYHPEVGFTVFTEDIAEPVQGNITVGWGSTDTQFKGRVKPRASNEETECSFKFVDHTEAWFDWSRDNLFIINTLVAPETYMLRVFDDSCILQYKSKPRTHKGLDSPVAFRPSGTVIAVSIWLETNKQRISLLEVNSDFELRDRMEPDIGLRIGILKWSPCGEYLVAYKEPVSEDATCPCVDIYICSNDVWSLGTRLNMGKFEMQYLTITQSNTNLVTVDLHFEKDVYRYQYVHKIIRSDNIIDNKGIIAVIKDKTINVHIPVKGIKAPKFEVANYTFKFKDIVFAVVFDQLNYRFAVVDITNVVSIFSYDDMELKLIDTLSLPDLKCEEPICHVSFYFNQDTFLSVGSRGMHWGCKLESDEDIAVIHNTDPPTMYTRFVDLEEIYQIPAQDVPLLELCPLSATSRISLNTNYQLIFEENLIEGRCTSFIKQDHFYLTTFHKESENTVDDQLLLIDRISMNQMRNGKSIFDVAFVRNVELGAILVTAISETSQVIIQLPRGNLELVEVRGMALIQLKSLLLDNAYSEIYNIIKLQSLGLDLLVDLDPELFIKNVEHICTEVLPKTVLIKFILELSNDNTLTSEDMKIMHVKRHIPNKRGTVCKAITDALLKLKNISEYLPPLICTALCNKNVGYDIPAALEMFECLCKKNYDRYKKPIKLTLDLLHNYVDYQDLYTQALLVYNVYIAELVAEKSNMDPQIYREQFKSFKVKDMDLMRFRVNDALKEHHRAVPYMSILLDKGLMDNKEVLVYAKRNNCLDTLYEVLSLKSPIFTDLSKLYAESLAESGKSADAALVLQRAKLHISAFGFYVKARMWRESLVCLNQAKLKPTPLRDYQMSLAVNLKTCGMHSEAAIVFMEYLHQVDLAVQCLYDAKEFTEALRYIHQGKEESMIADSLIPRLSGHMNERYTAYRSKEKKLKAYYLQLKDYVVRVQNNAHRNAEIFKGEEFDSYSDVLSVRTFRSTLTASSSVRSMRRRTRKLEKKCNDSREGSEYENVALIIKMHDVIHELNIIANDIIDCSILYSTIGSEKKLREFIRTSYLHIKDSEKYILELCSDVWSMALKNGSYEKDPRYFNIEVIDMKYRDKPEGFGYRTIPLIKYT